MGGVDTASVVRLVVARHGALSAVTTVTVALRMGLGRLGSGGSASDGVGGLRGCDLCLVFVAKAGEERWLLACAGSCCASHFGCGIVLLVLIDEGIVW